MLVADRLVALTSLRRKRALRPSGKTGQCRCDGTVTGHYRHIIDVALRIALEAEALRILISEIEVCRADLHRCCGFRQVWDPAGDRLRSVWSGLICRPELTGPRRLARTFHIAPDQVGDRRTENDRTGAIRLEEIPGAAVYCIDRDRPPRRLAGRGGAKREISAIASAAPSARTVGGANARSIAPTENETFAKRLQCNARGDPPISSLPF